MKKPLLSFHGDPAIKEKYLERLNNHRAADEIIQGIGYEETNGAGKGSAVGCTLNSRGYKAYETELGIPMILAKLEDAIFEGLPVEESKDFPIDFLSAIPVGKDLNNMYKHFFVWLLVDEKDGVIQYAIGEISKKLITDVADLLHKSLVEEVTPKQFQVLTEAAAPYAAHRITAAAAAAYTAATVATAASYAASDDVALASEAVAFAAHAAAVAYADAANFDVDAYDVNNDDAFDAAVYAHAAGRREKYSILANKLIELLKGV